MVCQQTIVSTHEADGGKGEGAADCAVWRQHEGQRPPRVSAAGLAEGSLESCGTLHSTHHLHCHWWLGTVNVVFNVS